MIIFLETACPAICISYGPIGSPCFVKSARSLPAITASSASKEIILKGARNMANFWRVLSPHLLFAASYSSSKTVTEEIASSDGLCERSFSVRGGYVFFRK
ncbi:MAG: hypothetical protein VZT48_09340 [Bulleidia sp.]|nr:hypothetical protein [Bulleidia sp.]